MDRRRTSSLDTPTPITDAVVENMRKEKGVPESAKWDRLEEHAREMERLAHSYRALAIAYNRP